MTATVLERAAARRALMWRRARLDLAEWVPLATPALVPPRHLQQLCDIFDAIERGEQVFALVEAPPRHGKTETCFHGLVRRLKHRPTARILYTTHTADLATEKSREARDLALRVGLWAGKEAEQNREQRFDPSASVRMWQTSRGGSFMVLGRGGKPIGRGFDLMVVDDPYGSLEEAESQVVRDSVWQWYTGTLFSRLEPGGSIIVCHQRWHDDDLIGRLKEQAAQERDAPNWVTVSLPAVRSDGSLLWDRYTIADLRRIEASVGPYVWKANYQQQPQKKGAKLFGSSFARFTPPLTEQRQRLVIAVDPAASKRTTADRWAVGLGSVTGRHDAMRLNVLRVWAFRAEVPEGVAFVRALQQRFACLVLAEGGGTQKGIPQTLERLSQGLSIEEQTPTADKFTRWQPTVGASRAGKILFPSHMLADDPVDLAVLPCLDSDELRAVWAACPEDWLGDVLAELARVTGVKDKHDDVVDMLTSLWDWAEENFGTASMPVPAPTTPAVPMSRWAGMGGKGF